MAYLVKINTVDITSYLKAPSGYGMERNKLWTDAGRNMSGNLRSTFLGIYPKITLDFKGGMSDAEMDTVLTLLDNSSFTLEWWDPVTRNYKSGTYYPGDSSISVHMRDGDNVLIYDTFKINLIPFNKMT